MFRPDPRRARRRAAALVVALTVFTPPVLSTTPAFATPRPAAITLPDGASKYVALAPRRLADTRHDVSLGAPFGFSNIDATTIKVDVAHRSGVPSNAVTAVLTVTIVSALTPGYVTAYPSGTTRPLASSANSDAPGRTIANMVHVKLGADGAAAIYNAANAFIVVDLVGVYVPVTGPVTDGRLVTLAGGAHRVFDSRLPVSSPSALQPGETRAVDVAPAGVPTNASAVVINITAVTAASGFFTAYPHGIERPGTSTINLDGPGQTRGGQAIVPLDGADGLINVYSPFGGHFVIDVVGWFTGTHDTAGTDGLFVSISPRRLFDSRLYSPLAPWSQSTFELPVSTDGFDAAAVALNLTATVPLGPGFLTAYPAGVTRPLASNLNYSYWPQTIGNHAIVRISNRGVAVYTLGGTHMVVDLAGFYLGTPTVATLPTPTNLSLPQSPMVAVSVPKLGLLAGVQAGSDLDAVADRNVGAVMLGTSLPSTLNTPIFGHRTVGKHIFRYINQLVIGDTFSVGTADGHWYSYVVVSRAVVPAVSQLVTALSNGFGPGTVQLVACSTASGGEGSVRYRIVITGRLTGVT